jgi:FlaA1/EpsC-like NDP-sugar epimerase
MKGFSLESLKGALGSKSLTRMRDNLSGTGRGRKQAFSVAVDALLVAGSLWGAYSLRSSEFMVNVSATKHVFLVLVPATVIVFAALGVYRWVVRSSNTRLFRQMVKGGVVSAVALAFVLLLFPPDRHNPRSLVIIYFMLLAISTCGIRLVWRSLFDHNAHGQPVAIYGVGSAGKQLLSAFAGDVQYRVVLLMDDNIGQRAATISGIPLVDASSDDLATTLRRLDVSRVILAMRLAYRSKQFPR